jgi:hypothetical protein
VKNHNFQVERRLLERCAKDDTEAQQEFSLLSYLSQIYRTAAETNIAYNNPLSDEELDDLCVVLTVQIYKDHKTLPSSRKLLYSRINDYVAAAVIRYIKGT